MRLLESAPMSFALQIEVKASSHRAITMISSGARMAGGNLPFGTRLFSIGFRSNKDGPNLTNRSRFRICDADRITLHTRHKRKCIPMFKMFVLTKRKPGMTMAEFKDYYENRHSKLAM